MFLSELFQNVVIVTNFDSVLEYVYKKHEFKKVFGSGKNELLLTALREKMGECFRIIVTWARCRRARCTAWEYYSESGRIYCNCGLNELVRISGKEDEEKGTKEIKLLFISRKKKREIWLMKF